MFTTPTALRAMTGVEEAGKRFPLGSLRVICSAGEPLNPEVIRWFREQFGVTVLDYYGLTESYPLCGNFPTVEVREGSMGRPMPGWEVAILDEDEQPLPVGERGEICLRARSNPHYPIGYWNRPEDTEEVFGGDWFHTKDAAELDEDGYVWYAGRADDVIISAGYRIGPFEVESACVEHPAVKEAAAVASPDPRRGDLVKAFIVLAAGHEPSDELATSIKQHVRERHSAYAYPREIEFVADLPKTLTGKIRRVELREQERERKQAQARSSVRRSGAEPALHAPAGAQTPEVAASRICSAAAAIASTATQVSAPPTLMRCAPASVASRMLRPRWASTLTGLPTASHTVRMSSPPRRPGAKSTSAPACSKERRRAIVSRGRGCRARGSRPAR